MSRSVEEIDEELRVSARELSKAAARRLIALREKIEIMRLRGEQLTIINSAETEAKSLEGIIAVTATMRWLRND